MAPLLWKCNYETNYICTMYSTGLRNTLRPSQYLYFYSKSFKYVGYEKFLVHSDWLFCYYHHQPLFVMFYLLVYISFAESCVIATVQYTLFVILCTITHSRPYVPHPLTDSHFFMVHSYSYKRYMREREQECVSPLLFVIIEGSTGRNYWTEDSSEIISSQSSLLNDAATLMSRFVDFWLGLPL